ncbi:MAG: tyrosine-type recombinase/integrase [Polaromonas sp.]|uniref:tyrosine-type recombinase/integrase n=1 Tax=Polaromonas sp. TaxID=1869339 RepID=UPI0027307052|nr:tyrosine-type recombinase/integrase [Polaromonas sp.]MDP2254985.1 tyrosine-type recombinase/integrase [Polaromonas sp.]
MASILPHAKGWRVQLTVKGQRDSQVFAFKRDAQQWAAQREIEMRRGSAVGGKTFSQAADRYLAEVSSKKDGAKWEGFRLAAMKVHFGDKTLAQIGQPEIAAWRDFRLKGDKDHRPVAGSTVQREKNLLRNVFTVARDEWHWMDHNPFQGVSMPDENDPRTALWDWKRIRRVLRFLGYVPGQKPETAYQQVALAFLIGLHTSLRASEILRVNAKTFNPATRVITVKTKTMKIAKVPITRRAVKLCKLADFTIDAPNLDALFRKARDSTLAGDFTFHDGRAFALTMLARKVDILTLSRISQHKDLSMLQRYYRETPEQVAGRL